MTALPVTLRLDPIACEGHGLCSELFPERITLDDWGYPSSTRRRSARARAACTTRRGGMPTLRAAPHVRLVVAGSHWGGPLPSLTRTVRAVPVGST